MIFIYFNWISTLWQWSVNFVSVTRRKFLVNKSVGWHVTGVVCFLEKDSWIFCWFWMCLRDESFGEQQACIQMFRVLKYVRGSHRGTGDWPSLVIHETCRTVNTDLRCIEICFHHLQACLDCEGADGNLRRNVGNYLPFGTEFILLDLNCHEYFPPSCRNVPVPSVVSSTFCRRTPC